MLVWIVAASFFLIGVLALTSIVTRIGLWPFCDRISGSVTISISDTVPTGMPLYSTRPPWLSPVTGPSK